VIPGLDDYLRRLERELRQHGLEDRRMLDEAREHLVDAVEEGRHRGLSDADAEREALERFGAPEAIAAHMLAERDRIMDRFAAALDTVWHRKWWILAPTALAAVITSVASYYLLPIRYRSESTILVVSARVPDSYVRVVSPPGTRLQQIKQQVSSRTRLEGIITDFGLFDVERKTAPVIEVVERMRRDIRVDVLRYDAATGVDVFRVSFVSSDARTAMRVTERLAGFFIDESLRDREVLVEGTTQVIETEIENVRRRIIEYEARLKGLRAGNGGQPLSQADLLPYVVLQERYRDLLTKVEDSRIAANLERRLGGEHYRILDAARLPEQPVGPDRVRVNAAGTFAGFGLGLALVSLRRRSHKTAA
jgi:hypothetical protein